MLIQVVLLAALAGIALFALAVVRAASAERRYGSRHQRIRTPVQRGWDDPPPPPRRRPGR